MKPFLRLFAVVFALSLAPEMTTVFGAEYQWTILAGNTGGQGSRDGIGSAARFYGPYGAAVDGSGNVYVADSSNHTIRKITSTGVVTTLAGKAGELGSANGTGSMARFNVPAGIAVDEGGNLYVADSYNHTIRKITSGGVVTTLAGKPGKSGNANGTGSTARFNSPFGVAVDSSGNVYVTDIGNYTIRKINSAGMVTTLAGKPGKSANADGSGSTARFVSPAGIAIDSGGNLYVADITNQTIRKIDSTGMVTTLAGKSYQSGSVDGIGSTARFNDPFGIAVDSSGNVYVADYFINTIRKITSTGVVTTLAGTAESPSGSADGTGSAAQFYHPIGVAADSSGNVYIADTANNTIRKITSTGVVTTLAGMAESPSGSMDGTGSAAQFNNPLGVTIDGSGNVYVADSFNHTIRKITSTGVVTTLAGKPGEPGSANGTGSTAQFYNPLGVAVDGGGNVYVADFGNNTIRKITSTGVVTTLAGMAGGSVERFVYPKGVAVDEGGNVYVTDRASYTIRKITSAGVVTTLAGKAGSSGSANGTGSAARFKDPYGVAVDSSGNVYVADTGNHMIRKITSVGVVTTLAGKKGKHGSADGTGSAARFSNPEGVAVDGSGNVYVADAGNCTIRKITSAGVVTTLGGKAGAYGNTEGSGSEARFDFPIGIAATSDGILYVANSQANSIFKGVYTTAAPTLPTPAFNARSENPQSVALALPAREIEMPQSVKPAYSAPVNRMLAPARTPVHISQRAELAGTYNAVLASEGAPSLNNTGLLSVTVTTTGSFSGKLLASKASVPFSGFLGDDGAAHFKSTRGTTFDLFDKSHSNLHLGTLAFSIADPSGMRGTFSSQAAEGGVLASFAGKKAPYNSVTPVPVELLNLPAGSRPIQGAYNVVFPAQIQEPAPDPATYPQADGYARLNLSKTGGVILSGYLGDGTKYAAAGKLRADNTVPLFTLLYNKGGVFSGELAFANLAGSDVSGTGILWLRSAGSAGAFYRAGCPAGITVGAVGTK